jgi:prevent-host-death family protein
MAASSVSKSRFKAHALELFRQVERTGQPLIITDRGTPVLKISPYREDPKDALVALRDTVAKYEAPTRPVGASDWESSSRLPSTLTL